MRDHIDRSLTYGEYTSLIDELLEQGKTTGPNQSAAMFEYGRINRQRMKRLAKTIKLSEEVIVVARQVRSPMIWLTITEGWCGDAAQNIPVIEAIAAETGLIETRYILRDENLDLMDGYLTRGARSIPKLIALDAATLDVKGTWGPRPQAAQELYDRLKAEDVPKLEIMEQLQRWYNSDGTRSLQTEFVELLSLWKGESAKAAG